MVDSAGFKKKSLISIISRIIIPTHTKLLIFMLKLKHQQLICGSLKDLFHALWARGANIHDMVQ